MQPLAFSARNDTLCAENDAVLGLIKLLKSVQDIILRVLFRGLDTDAREYFIRVMSVMVMMVVLMVVFMLMVMIMVAAAMIVIIVIVVIVVMVVMLMLVIVVIIVMVVMMLVLVLIIVIVIMVVMVMVMMALLAFVMMVYALGADACGLKKLLFEIGVLLHCLKDGLAGKLIPGCRNKNSLVIVLADQLNSLFKLSLAAVLCTAPK